MKKLITVFYAWQSHDRRRFLLHVLPRGFHRIRHCGLLAGATRKSSLALALGRAGRERAGDSPADGTVGKQTNPQRRVHQT